MNVNDSPNNNMQGYFAEITNGVISKITADSENELHLQINDFVAYAHQNPHQNCVFTASFLKDNGSLADMPAVKIIFRANKENQSQANNSNEIHYFTEVTLKNNFTPKFTKRKEKDNIELDYFPLRQEALPFLLKDYEEHVQHTYKNSGLHLTEGLNKDADRDHAIQVWKKNNSALAKLVMETLPEHIRPKLQIIAQIEKGDAEKSQELLDLVWKNRSK